MFVYSLKASKLKFFALLILFAAVAALIIPRAIRDVPITDALAGESGLRFDGIKTEDDLYRFISEAGIEVKTPHLKSVHVDIPRASHSVYKKYNDIQKQQGFNLEKYRGKHSTDTPSKSSTTPPPTHKPVKPTSHSLPIKIKSSAATSPPVTSAASSVPSSTTHGQAAVSAVLCLRRAPFLYN